MDFPIKEEIKASLVRLWFAGLVCYLVLWGSSVSNDFLDLLLLLPLAHFLCDVLLTNPIVRAVFKTRLRHGYMHFWRFFLPKLLSLEFMRD